MGYIVLLNDVSTTLDEEKMIVGDSDAPISELGTKQSLDVATRIQTLFGHPALNLIAASKSSRISKLVHHIRTKSPNGKLANLETRFLDSLKERSFGVLTGSQHPIDSDLFTHSRITAEGGESVAQVRDRMVSTISNLCAKHKNICLVSHPFACQITFNALLSKKHTVLTKFWLSKGSVAVLNYAKGKFGNSWKFQRAINLLSERNYTLDEIYNEIV